MEAPDRFVLVQSGPASELFFSSALQLWSNPWNLAITHIETRVQVERNERASHLWSPSATSARADIPRFY
jgi:hypothetical protein